MNVLQTVWHAQGTTNLSSISNVIVVLKVSSFRTTSVLSKQATALQTVSNVREANAQGAQAFTLCMKEIACFPVLQATLKPISSAKDHTVLRMAKVTTHHHVTLDVWNAMVKTVLYVLLDTFYLYHRLLQPANSKVQQLNVLKITFTIHLEKYAISITLREQIWQNANLRFLIAKLVRQILTMFVCYVNLGIFCTIMHVFRNALQGSWRLTMSAFSKLRTARLRAAMFMRRKGLWIQS